MILRESILVLSSYSDGRPGRTHASLQRRTCLSVAFPRWTRGRGLWTRVHYGIKSSAPFAAARRGNRLLHLRYLHKPPLGAMSRLHASGIAVRAGLRLQHGFPGAQLRGAWLRPQNLDIAWATPVLGPHLQDFGSPAFIHPVWGRNVFRGCGLNALSPLAAAPLGEPLQPSQCIR